MKFIDQNLYNKILESVPIICVDGIIKNENSEILFLKRSNEPEKDEWWIPGGRVIKNEKLSDAIIRKVKEETSLDVDVNRIIGITETSFETGINDIQTHTINITFLLELKSGIIYLDQSHHDYMWSKNLEDLNLNPELKKILIKQ